MVEELTGKWWFLCLMAAAQLLPPYSSAGYHFHQHWFQAAATVLGHPFYSPARLYPVLKAIPLVLLAMISIRLPVAGRFLALYVALNFIGITFHQAIGWSAKLGIIVNSVGATMFGLIALVWAREAIAPRTDFTKLNMSWPRAALVIAGVLALCYPINSDTQRPDFRPGDFLSNGAGLAFCTTTPLYLAMLLLAWPRVNHAVLRITSVIGLMIAVYDCINVADDPRVLWWNGILHLPLLLICGIGMHLSLKEKSRGDSARQGQLLTQ